MIMQSNLILCTVTLIYKCMPSAYSNISLVELLKSNVTASCEDMAIPASTQTLQPY